MNKEDLKPYGEICLVHAKSKKSGEFYTALVLDLGYKKKFLNFGFSEIAELLDLKPSELEEICDKKEEFTLTIFS